MTTWTKAFLFLTCVSCFMLGMATQDLLDHRPILFASGGDYPPMLPCAYDETAPTECYCDYECLGGAWLHIPADCVPPPMYWPPEPHECVVGAPDSRCS